ncbi:hypothetical protein SAMN04489735_104621 [Aneurinibacillus thermoaerophilus]|uniref:Uncharacterized protein n=1 Tax=Aneurinibacillus thermoaerophilus TaxID=143495 RepID=A0A1G8ENP8_ANETH|nr:hypothetical protein SAMN04489735_104621 [Aneurinibacillus thermoaerophilus]
MFLLYHHYIQKGWKIAEIDALSYFEKELLMASMIEERKRMIKVGLL